MVLPPFYRTWWFLVLLGVASVSVVTVGYRYRVTQLHRRQAAQEEFSRQLIRIEENERRRIASELHDGLGQRLVIIRNWALLGSPEIASENSAFEHLQQINQEALEAIHEVREIAYNLAPHHLDRIGLANTLKDMLGRVAQASGMCFRVSVAELSGALPRDAEISFFRIVQEAVSNVVKHAAASEAEVTILREAGLVKLLVSDNGKGFDASASIASAERNGFGLAGIAERVRLLGGSSAVRSTPGHGTRLEVTLQAIDDVPQPKSQRLSADWKSE